MEIKFQGELTKEIVKRGVRMLRNKKARRIGILYGLFMSVGMCVISFANSETPAPSTNISPQVTESVGPALGFQMILGCLLPLILLIFVVYIVVRSRNANQIWKNNPGVQGNRAGEATPDHLHTIGDDFDTTIKWSGFIEYRISEDMLLLFVAKQSAHFMPREFFANDTDWQQFITLVKEKLPEKKR